MIYMLTMNGGEWLIWWAHQSFNVVVKSHSLLSDSPTLSDLPLRRDHALPFRIVVLAVYFPTTLSKRRPLAALSDGP